MMVSRLRFFSISALLFFFLGAFSRSDGQVIITEIMYNPSGNENYTEYVEVYNTGTDSVNMIEWGISDGDAQDWLVPPIPGNSTYLRPGAFAIILDSGYWEHGEGWYDDAIPEGTLLITTPDAAIGSGGLSNSRAETVSLITPNFQVVSSRTYRLGAEQGVSEERILVFGDESDDNWAFSAPGGTPGRTNSVTPPDFDLALDSLSLGVLDIGTTPFPRLTIFAKITNLGFSEVSNRILQLWLDHHLQGDLWLIAQWPIPTLNWNDDYQLLDTLEISDPGGYAVRVRVDFGDSDTLNNSVDTSIQVPYPFGSMRFSELMPDPPADVVVEWAELVNRLGEAIPLGGWSFHDASGQQAYCDSSAFAQITLPADGYHVLAADSALIAWPDLPPGAFSLPDGWPTLNNSGDSLTLLDPSGKVIDRVAYGEAETGISFNRITESDTFSITDWSLSTYPDRGTPGGPNSAPSSPPSPDDPPADNEIITISPNPFSPDGDGRDDSVIFQLSYPANEVEITLRIFDVNGRRVAVPLSGERMPGTGSFQWNGRTGSGRTLPTGIYPFHLFIREIDGSSRREMKGTVVIAGSGHG